MRNFKEEQVFAAQILGEINSTSVSKRDAVEKFFRENVEKISYIDLRAEAVKVANTTEPYKYER